MYLYMDMDIDMDMYMYNFRSTYTQTLQIASNNGKVLKPWGKTSFQRDLEGTWRVLGGYVEGVGVIIIGCYDSLFNGYIYIHIYIYMYVYPPNNPPSNGKKNYHVHLTPVIPSWWIMMCSYASQYAY